MIKAILWDVDGTLLDFRLAEKLAIKACFERFDIHPCTDEMIARYAQINAKYWLMLEMGEITKPQVLRGRFQEFFALEQISFDDIEEFNALFQIKLGDTIVFNDDGYNIVKELKESVKQYAVTNGTFAAQERKLKKSGLIELFDDVFISDKIGWEKPSMGFFNYVFENMPDYSKSEMLIVGDSLTSDIQGGNNAGIRCCWYNPRRAANDKKLRIDYEISNLWEIKKIIAAG